MNESDIDEIARRVTERLQMLHLEGEERFGRDRWNKVCEIGTARGVFKSPYDDSLTRELIENRPEVLYALAVNDGLLGRLAEMSEREAVQWLRENADDIATELIDPEDLSVSGFQDWRKRRESRPAPGSMDEYVARRNERLKRGG
jgi:hypothetical protein